MSDNAAVTIREPIGGGPAALGAQPSEASPMPPREGCKSPAEWVAERSAAAGVADRGKVQRHLSAMVCGAAVHPLLRWASNEALTAEAFDAGIALLENHTYRVGGSRE